VAVEDAPERVEGTETASEPPAESTPSPASEDGHEAVRDPDARERSREAAGYRVRLREAEATLAERDGVIVGLREEVDRLHRAEAERLAGDALASPSDLWLVAELAEFRDDAGRLDAEKITAKVEDVVRERPAWRRMRTPSFDGGARAPIPEQRAPGLSDLLKPETRR
jgi:hypothetical protein